MKPCLLSTFLFSSTSDMNFLANKFRCFLHVCKLCRQNYTFNLWRMEHEKHWRQSHSCVTSAQSSDLVDPVRFSSFHLRFIADITTMMDYQVS